MNITESPQRESSLRLRAIDKSSKRGDSFMQNSRLKTQLEGPPDRIDQGRQGLRKSYTTNIGSSQDLKTEYFQENVDPIIVGHLAEEGVPPEPRLPWADTEQAIPFGRIRPKRIQVRNLVE